jgi:molecular chaperone DnaK
MASKVIGIDLGTTNSVVAVMEGGEPAVIVNQEGGRTTPSVIGFTKEGERLVGQVAKRQGVTNPENTIFSIKRFMGRKHAEVPQEISRVPYKVVKADNGDAWMEVRGKKHSPPEISAMILQKLKTAAEDYLGEKATDAVITVPAYFDDAQRQATRDAGQIAGLDVVRILNEPTAAALAYGAHRVANGRRLIAVFDLGGGTFDISIMAVENGIFEVLSTGGDSALGGEDWDRRILERIVDEVFDRYRVDLTQVPMALSRLRDAAEAAKKALSAASETMMQLPFLANDQHGAPINYERSVTRDEIEQLTQDLLDKVEAPCRRALADAGLSAADVEEVLLVGGMTRWPAVQRTVEKLFNRKPSKGANPDEVVALGAAAYAGILSGDADDAALLDVTPHDIGIKVGDSGFSVIIPRNSMLPVRVRKLFATASENQKFVSIELYQGESADLRGNRKLGQVVLDDLPPGPAGSVRVELVMTVDVESILGVTARELKSGKEASVTIRPSGGLSQREIVEIINRRRQESSFMGHLPTEGGTVSRIATREMPAVTPPPDDEKK